MGWLSPSHVHFICFCITVCGPLLWFLLDVGLVGTAFLLLLPAVNLFATALWMIRWVKTNSIPGPTPIPVFGNGISMLEYKTHLQDYLLRNCLDHGFVFGLWMVSGLGFVHRRSVGAYHPDAARQILHSELDNFDRSDIEKRLFGVFLGGGLILQDNGPAWKSMRDRFQPAFKRKRLQEMHPLLRASTQGLLETLGRAEREGTVVDMQALIQQLTFDVILKFALGVDLTHSTGTESKTSRLEEFSRAWSTVLEECNHRFFFQIFPYWKVVSIRRFDDALACLVETIYSALGERKAEMAGKKQHAGAGSGEETWKSRSLLSFILTNHPDMTRQQIRNELLTFLFAGHDTTTNLITRMLYYAATLPEVDARICTERLQGTADGPSHEPTGGEGTSAAAPTHPLSLRQLPYLRAVLDETLRLHPSAPFRGRTTRKNTTIGGYHIPAGSTVGWGAYVTHRHPEVWAEPNTFIPERFLREGEDTLPALRPKHGFAYIPFGAGARKCIGAQMAIEESMIIVSELLGRFRLEFVGKEPPQDETVLTMRIRGGLPMRPISRM